MKTTIPEIETQQRYLYTSKAEANFRKDTWQHTSSPRLIKKKGGGGKQLATEVHNKESTFKAIGT